MKNKYLNLVAATLIGGFSFAGNASADTADFIGEWVNVDAEAQGGVTRFVLVQTEIKDVLKIEVFGKCHPSDCEWGEETLALYGANASDDNYQFGSARYEKNFADTLLTMELLDDGRIALDKFTEFLDNSDRDNYHSFDLFRKTDTHVAQCPDLIIEQIKRPVYISGVGSQIEAVVKNIGNKVADSSWAYLLDSATGKYAYVPELAPGASFTVQFQLPYWVFNPDAIFTVTADFTKHVVECNESNNVKRFFSLG